MQWGRQDTPGEAVPARAVPARNMRLQPQPGCSEAPFGPTGQPAGIGETGKHGEQTGLSHGIPLHNAQRVITGVTKDAPLTRRTGRAGENHVNHGGSARASGGSKGGGASSADITRGPALGVSPTVGFRFLFVATSVRADRASPHASPGLACFSLSRLTSCQRTAERSAASGRPISPKSGSAPWRESRKAATQPVNRDPMFARRRRPAPTSAARVAATHVMP